MEETTMVKLHLSWQVREANVSFDCFSNMQRLKVLKFEKEVNLICLRQLSNLRGLNSLHGLNSLRGVNSLRGFGLSGPQWPEVVEVAKVAEVADALDLIHDLFIKARCKKKPSQL